MARTLAAIDAEALPDDVVDKARLALLDFLACAFESRGRAWCRQAVELAIENSGKLGCGTSSIVGHARKVALGDAAFANAVLGHGLVRDDMHVGSVSHLGVAVMPVVLGLAQLEPTDGRRFLAAIVAGYEAGATIGRMILDVDVARIHRPTGITGPLAAAAAAARLLGLEAGAFASALSLAANTTGGFNQWAASGGDEMFFEAGFAARNGLTAARLASLGARGSLDAIDGPAGLLAAFGKPRDAALERAGLDGAGLDGAGLERAGLERAGLEISNVFFKQVPACNYAQSPAQAARALAERHALSTEQIERITVHVSHAAAAYPGCDASGPFERELEARMSIQYNVAAALATADLDAASADPAADAAVAALARKTELVVDDALTRAYPARQGAEVRVQTTDGRELGERVDDVEPAAPALVRSRFERAAAAAVGEHAADNLLSFVDGLETSANAGDLLLLSVPGEIA